MGSWKGVKVGRWEGEKLGECGKLGRWDSGWVSRKVRMCEDGCKCGRWEAREGEKVGKR